MMPGTVAKRKQASVVTFTTEGATFAPQLIVAGTPSIQWTTSDGQHSTSLTPTFTFSGVATRTAMLTVSPASAVLSVLLGYDGTDGGAESTVVPDLVRVQAQQDVSAIDGLTRLRGLQCLTLSYNPIATLNVSGLPLQRLEGFGCGLTSFFSSSCSALRRICLEKREGDPRITTPYDLSSAANVEDVRGANNDMGTIYWAPGSLLELWHICVGSSLHPMAADAFPAVSRLPVIQQFYMNGTGRSGIIDLRGGFPPGRDGDVWLQQNAVTGIDCSTGCEGLLSLNARENSMGQAAVDAVLVDINAYGSANGFLNLLDNTAPSVTGLAAAAELTGRGWTVFVDP